MNNIRYKSEVRIMVIEGDTHKYRMEIEAGGEESIGTFNYVVYQVDLDEQGKPWNATPCVARETFREALDYINSQQEQK